MHPLDEKGLLRLRNHQDPLPGTFGFARRSQMPPRIFDVVEGVAAFAPDVLLQMPGHQNANVLGHALDEHLWAIMYF